MGDDRCLAAGCRLGDDVDEGRSTLPAAAAAAAAAGSLWSARSDDVLLHPAVALLTLRARHTQRKFDY